MGGLLRLHEGQSSQATSVSGRRLHERSSMSQVRRRRRLSRSQAELLEWVKSSPVMRVDLLLGGLQVEDEGDWVAIRISHPCHDFSIHLDEIILGGKKHGPTQFF